MLKIEYKNDIGTVRFSGGGNQTFKITNLLGFGLAEREYITADYSGYDGCETVASRFLPRTITISGDVSGNDIAKETERAINIFSEPGYLYISNGTLGRRIYCNRISFPDVTRILRGQIATFAIQMVCDNPYFEDAEDTASAVYSRTKCLSSPFTLPTVFSTTTAGATLVVESRFAVEPIFRIYFAQDISNATSVTIENSATGKKISLQHTPKAGELITIDIKNRTAESSISGNILNELTDDSFIGDFVLIKGENPLSIFAGDVWQGITVECRYNNRYVECAVV